MDPNAEAALFFAGFISAAAIPAACAIEVLLWLTRQVKIQWRF